MCVRHSGYDDLKWLHHMGLSWPLHADVRPDPVAGLSRSLRLLEGHESARTRGKHIGGAAVTDEAVFSMALHLRDRGVSLRDIAAQLVITKGKKKGRPLTRHRPAHAA
jgi:hypothetical protein